MMFARPSADEFDSTGELVEIRYSLPELLRDVRRDKTSVAFAMEKLDQAAINSIFEQQQARNDSGLRK